MAETMGICRAWTETNLDTAETKRAKRKKLTINWILH